MRAFVFLASLLAAHPAAASRGVRRTLTGCVLDRRFYDVDGLAYRISTPATLDLTPFEGKALSMTGMLYPGDRFVPDGPAPQELGACPAESRRLIRRDQVIALRGAAARAVEAGDFDAARAAIGRAMALVPRPDCDTLTDRATVFASMGDTATAAADVATIRARQCVVDEGHRMNPLLLVQLSLALTRHGDKKTASAALRLARAACAGDWCRDIFDEARAALGTKDGR